MSKLYQIKMHITKGELEVGDSLPSIRTLSRTLQVSIISVQRAYDELQKEGVIDSVPGKGIEDISFDVLKGTMVGIVGLNGAGKTTLLSSIIGSVNKIRDWYIGGHSLGGAMASSYASNHASILRGIFLLGAYPASNLSGSNLTLVSIYGENDIILNRQKLEDTKSNAPAKAYFYEIIGANHGGFGDYGMQEGDGDATISSDEQIKETIRLLMEGFQK